MDLLEQAQRRVALAREMGCQPVKWVATEATAGNLGGGESLYGLPLIRGSPKSNWGLDLIVAARAG